MSSFGKYPNYQDYLDSPEWKIIRDATVSRAGGRCQICDSNKYVTAHHRNYSMLDSEDGRNLIAICKECHSLYELGGKYMKQSLADAKELANDVRRCSEMNMALFYALKPDLGCIQMFAPNPPVLYDISKMQDVDIDLLGKVLESGDTLIRDDECYIDIHKATKAAGVSIKRMCNFVNDVVLQTVLALSAEINGYSNLHQDPTRLGKVPEKISKNSSVSITCRLADVILLLAEIRHQQSNRMGTLKTKTGREARDSE